MVIPQCLWLSQYEAIFQGAVLWGRDGLLLLKKVTEYGIDFLKHQLGETIILLREHSKCVGIFYLVVHVFNQLDKYLNIVVNCAEIS